MHFLMTFIFHKKQLYFFGEIIDSISRSPICVLEGKYRESKNSLKIVLKNILKETATWSMFTKCLRITLDNI